MDFKKIIKAFFLDSIGGSKIEVYNEFSLQHELENRGMFLL
jgi:hypothetical protein